MTPYGSMIFVLLALLTIGNARCRAQCSDSMLLDNSRPLLAYGLDTTNHWWAIREVNATLVELVVDGSVVGTYQECSKPLFSPDGSTWAVTTLFNGRRGIVRNSGTIDLGSVTKVSQLLYPYANPELWYVVSVESQSTLTNGERAYIIPSEPLSVYADPSGTMIFYVIQQSGQQTLYRNGALVTTAEKIDLRGVWSDGRAVTSIFNGSTYTVSIGDEQLLYGYRSIVDLHVNQFGTVCAWIAGNSTGQVVPMMMSDTYKEPWTGSPLLSYTTYTLSPCCDVLATLGKKLNSNPVIYYNSADYPAGSATSTPVFSYDGSQMTYSGFDGEDFVSVNGKMHRLKGGGVPKSSPLSIGNTGNTVAWSSASTLVVYDFDYDAMRMGKMCDVMQQPMYNRFTNTYQALGTYGGRLYRLECRAR